MPDLSDVYTTAHQEGDGIACFVTPGCQSHRADPQVLALMSGQSEWDPKPVWLVRIPMILMQVSPDDDWRHQLLGLL